MTDNNEHLPWNTGMSTRPDVESLLKQWPPETIAPGVWRATDDEVRALLGRADGNRYRTIYDAWVRRLKRDHNVIVYREKEVGFYCPTPDEVFSRTHPTLVSAGRILRKQMRSVAIVKPENDAQRSTQDHQGRLLYVQTRELKKTRMNLLPDTAKQEFPRISPPRKEGNKP